MLELRWAGNPLLLLLMMMGLVGGAVVVQRLVPGRSTAGQSCYNLSLLCVLVYADHIIHDVGITDKLRE
jgi:hypothetical protein